MKKYLLIALFTVIALYIFQFAINSKASAADSDNYMIMIDLNESRLYLIDIKNNVIVNNYPVATGKYETPSPIGSFKIAQKSYWSTGPFGTRWLGLNVPYGSFGIHGTNSPDSIGWPSSHGCFRMRNKDVEDLFKYVEVGTSVVTIRGSYGLIGDDYEIYAPGDRNSLILLVQLKLKKYKYYNGEINGIYTQELKESVLKYKADKNLPNNHFIDETLCKSLKILKFD